MIISSEKKMSKNNSSFFNAITQIPQNKTSTLSIIFTNNTKANTNEFLIKIETPLDFIKQRKQFIIDDIFDLKGTKEFLASKDVAMETIHLEDEIIDQKKIENTINTVISENDSKNNACIKEKNNKKAKYNFSPKKDNNCNKKYINTELKNNKKKLNNNKEKKSENNNDNHNNRDNNILIIEKKASDSQDSNFYKFILENANDSDAQFQKKLKKVLNKVEKEKKKQKKESQISKSIRNKKRKSIISQKNEIDEIEQTRFNSANNIKKRKNNLFIFSEKAKYLMTKDSDIELSSIDNNNNNIKKLSPNKNNIKIKDKNENILFGEKEKEFIDGKRDSIISILDEF